MQEKDKRFISDHDPIAWFIFTLVLLGCIIYSNTFRSPFYLDDIFSIVDNPAIRHLSSLRAVWDFWPTRFITYLSLAINYHFHQLNVLGYHVLNLFIHLGSAFMVWWLILLTFSTPLLREQKIARHAHLISFLAGLVFVSHPIQTQAVTYIIQRAASLAAFFYLASLCLYVKSRLLADARIRPGLQNCYYAASLLAALLAMFTKETTITLPLVIALYEFSFFKTKKKLERRRLIPFLAFLLIVPLTMLLTKSVNFMERRHVGEALLDISTMSYLLTQFRVLVTYLRLLVLPLNQNLDYDYPVANSLLELPTLASLLFLIGLVIFAIKLWRNHRLISFCIFWFFITLLPESSAIPIRDVIFEHRLYLPMVGYSLFLVLGFYALLGKHNFRAMVVLFVLILISFSVLTYARNAIWKDEITLWNDVVRKSPHKSRPYYNRGYAYQSKGHLDQALSDYTLAIAFKPDFSDYYNNRGSVYQCRGNLDLALLDYNKALEIQPRYAGVYYNRGNVYRSKGDLGQAISDYTKALEIDPGFVDAYLNRGYLYRSKGDLDQAISDYTRVLEIEPASAKAWNNRAEAYFKKQEYDKSWEDVHQAQRLGFNVSPGLLEQLQKVSGKER